MAKVSGPLMSMGASGKFAGALVFATRLGQNVVRQLVTPGNPMSAGQMTARNLIRATGAMQRFTNLATTKGSGRTTTDKALLKYNAPSGQTWNSYLNKIVVGANAATAIAGQAAWAATTSGNKTTWDGAAAALTPVILAVAQKAAGGVASTSLSAGNVWYLYQYGLYAAGLAPAPVAGTPPTYA